jgi:hypothetical protein
VDYLMKAWPVHPRHGRSNLPRSRFRNSDPASTYRSLTNVSATGQSDLRCPPTNTAQTVIVRLLTPEENRFLDAFLREATTPPFTGPATVVLHSYGLEYGDISYLAWAYEQDVHRTGFSVGHAADMVPPLPWPDRQSALRRNEQIQRIREERRQASGVTVSTH